MLPACLPPLLLLLVASRPASVDGFALKPHGGGLPGGNARYSQCAAMGAEATRAASCLFFMGGGGGAGGAKEDEDSGGHEGGGGGGGDHGKKALLLDAELHLVSGYPFPHASRSNIRRRAMNFLR